MHNNNKHDCFESQVVDVLGWSMSFKTAGRKDGRFVHLYIQFIVKVMLKCVLHNKQPPIHTVIQTSEPLCDLGCI